MKRLVSLLAVAMLMVSCGALSEISTSSEQNAESLGSSAKIESLTREGLYPMMYEEKPVTLLVMPPINNTTNVEAKDYLYTSISKPLIEAGYYVISPLLAMDIFREESAYDSELFINASLAPFLQVFGADAVVFSEINEWTKVGMGIDTDLKYIIKSTRTGEILFERNCDLYLDLGPSSSSSDSALIQLLDLAISAAKTLSTDHIEAARMANEYVFQDIPRGKYSDNYLQDQNSVTDKRDISILIR